MKITTDVVVVVHTNFSAITPPALNDQERTEDV